MLGVLPLWNIYSKLFTMTWRGQAVANIAHAGNLHAQAESPRQAIGGIRFDWLMIGLMMWFLGGLFVDGWAHSHGKVDESFFTPWHGLFYSGFAVVAGALGGAIARNRQLGYGWRHAVPAGYGLSLLGATIFALGGGFDLLWHTLFGIEENVEALLSPSHLLLALGMVLVLSGPLRAAWRRPIGAGAGIAPLLPAVISLTFTWSVLSFMAQWAHPYLHLLSTSTRLGEAGQALGIAGIVLQTALAMGFILLAMRRWQLPFGSLTLALGLNAALMSVMRDRWEMIIVALVAGLAADLLALVLRPSVARPTALRLWALAVPAILYVCYFTAIALLARIVWSLHLWTGAIVLAGITGLLLSYLLVPPALPDGTTEVPLNA